MTEDDAVYPWSRALALNPMRGAHSRWALPIKYLAIVGRIIGKTIKLRDFSRGNRQAHEKKQNWKDPAHRITQETSPEDMIAPNQPGPQSN